MDIPELGDCEAGNSTSGRQRATTKATLSCGLLIATWLTGLFIGSLVGRSYSRNDALGAQLVLAFAVLWPMALLVFSRHAIKSYRLPFGTKVCVWGFLVACLLSSIDSADVYSSIAYTVLTAGAIFISVRAVARLNEQCLEKAFRNYVILMTPVLLWILIKNASLSQRFTVEEAGLNPNTVALIMVSVIFSSYAFRSVIVTTAWQTTPVAILLLTQSRASLLGTVLGLVFVYFVKSKGAKGKKILLWVMGIIVLIGVCMPYVDQISDAISRQLALNDRYRGVNSGATGRVLAWAETWQLFLEHPVLGVGFRAHEKLLRVGSSSHNGYLALLAEIGVCGFVPAICFVITGVVALMRMALRQPSYRSYTLLAATAVAYLFIAMFERYLINIGNPTSLMFVIAISLGASRQTGHRVLGEKSGRLSA